MGDFDHHSHRARRSSSLDEASVQFRSARFGKSIVSSASVLVQIEQGTAVENRAGAGRTGADGGGRSQASRVAGGRCDLDDRQLRPRRSGKKLGAIESAKKSLEPELHATPRTPPSDAENVTALQQGVHALEGVADQQGAGANAARRLADAMKRLSEADEAQRVRTRDAFIRPLQLDLDDIEQSLMAERVTRQSLPADLVGDWVAADGRMRIEVWPKGNASDNATVRRFAQAVLAVEPTATGEAIGSIEWGATIVRAFIEAMVLALISIAILLWIVLRRITDVLVTLIPLIVAGLVTLEICALTNFQLNYANIIALPVLLGVGVAFKIYYVTAWRRGESNFLELVLTRAVFYSTLLTATAFGSLWVSNQPGISSMGKLLALSLLCTLTSAALFQPALMGEPRRQDGETAKPMPSDRPND